MKTYIEPQKEIDVHYEADVVVVGGGPAGIGAALAAARNGAKTVLLERYGCLGGLQTQCYQVMFTFCDPKIQGGIVQEILNRLEAGGAMARLEDTPKPTNKGRFHQLIAAVKGKDAIPKRMYERVGYWWQWGREFDPEYYKIMLDEMMVEAGVKIIYHSFATNGLREGDTLRGVTIESKEGRKAVLGKIVVDTTGEADIAWKSGAPVIGGEGIQLGNHKGTQGGMVNAFYIGGVDLEKFEKFRDEHPGEWRQGVCGKETISKGLKDGYHVRAGWAGAIIFPKQGNRLWTMFPMYVIRDQNAHTWHLEEITKSEIELRKQAWGLQKLFKDRVPGFENSYVEKTPIVALNGEPHRMEGDYILTVNDMREGKHFDDAVGINNMIPDLYSMTHRLAFDILPHDIPYRCLYSKGIDNLMSAGTSMSCGSIAMTGLRYCIPSIIQGQAVGTAAAIAAKHDVKPKDVNIKQLQETLKDQGAYISVNDIEDEVFEPYRVVKDLTTMAGKHELYDEIGNY